MGLTPVKQMHTAAGVAMSLSASRGSSVTGVNVVDVGLCHELRHKRRIVPTIVSRIVTNSGKES